MPTAVLADPNAERRAGDRFALESAGADVIEVASLKDALSAVAANAPEVVVLAAELCQAITPARLAGALRAQPETAGIRIVLLDDHGSATDGEGTDAVLRRPTWPLDLVAAAFG